MREAIGSPRPPYECERYNNEVVQARATLGVAAFDAAFAQGHALTLEQAVAMALGKE